MHSVLINYKGDVPISGSEEAILCGQAKSSQHVMLGSGMHKHAETSGVWGPCSPGARKITISETASGSF